MIKILVVEDERAISDLIRMNLEDAGYACTCVYDGMAAADQIETQTFDLVLLDIMLPKVNGYELLEYIKPTGTPVIFLTAKAGLDDRVKGLNLGAEDYIVKPFEIVELIARVQVVLRRFHKDVTKLVYGDLVINTDNRTVLRDGVPVELTPKEFMLYDEYGWCLRGQGGFRGIRCRSESVGAEELCGSSCTVPGCGEGRRT